MTPRDKLEIARRKILHVESLVDAEYTDIHNELVAVRGILSDVDEAFRNLQVNLD